MSVDQYITSGILELYAVNALPPEEMREVEEMVEKHARIRQELDAINEGLRKYAEMYAPAPSEGLYDNIIEKINAAPAAPVQVETKTVPLPAVNREKEKEPVKKEEKPKVEKLKNVDTSPNRSGRYVLLMAASILLLLVSIGINIYLYNQYNSAQGTISELQNEKNVMVNNEKATQAKFSQTEAQLKLFTDKNNKMVMMKGMPISPASEVMVMWNTTNKEVFVDIHKLPAPPDGMQYQLWAIDKEGKPVDAGMLTPSKERTEKGPQPMKKIENAIAFAITLEHRGGSPTPTVDKMYVKGQV